MEFHNPPILVNELPRAEAIELQPLERKYLSVMLRRWILFWGAILAIAAVAWFIFLETVLWAAILFAVVAVPAIIHRLIIQAGFRIKGFAIREHDLLYRSGWLVEELKVVPYNRIQNCSVEAGLIERRLGLAAIHIFTAGSGDADLEIPGLTQENADTIRKLITDKIVQHAAS